MRLAIISWCAVCLTACVIINNVTTSIKPKSITDTIVTGISYDEYKKRRTERQRQRRDARAIFQRK